MFPITTLQEGRGKQNYWLSLSTNTEIDLKFKSKNKYSKLYLNLNCYSQDSNRKGGQFHHWTVLLMVVLHTPSCDTPQNWFDCENLMVVFVVN